MGDFGPEPKGIVSALIEAFKDKDSSIRHYAAHYLGRFRSAAKEAVPVLIEALKDENAMIRFYAASVLGSIGPDAMDQQAAATKGETALR